MIGENDSPARQVLGIMQDLAQRGLNTGSAGNASIRIDPHSFLITPSGVVPQHLRESQLCAVTLGSGGTVPAGVSSEWRMHHDIYTARPDARAIVHTHSVHAAALSCLRKPIPAFHYMVAKAGGDSIACAPYATFGSQELSDHALEALHNRRACLLANHGVVALGASAAEAMDLAIEVEHLAQQYLIALRAGAPIILGAEEMQAVIEKFRHYGQGYD